MLITRGLAQASIFIATCLFTGSCAAQPAPSMAMAASSEAKALSDLVLEKYPYANGSLGPDWCRTFEAASAPEWWEFNQTDGAPGVDRGWRTLRVRKAVRLQSIYEDTESFSGGGGHPGMKK
jgi:hypothetical protein